MSLFEKLRGGSRTADDIPKAELRDGEVPEQSSAGVTVFSTQVTQNTDLLKVKDQLYNGNMVIIELVNEDYSLDRERVFEELKNTVDDTKGDIALTDENTVVVTPASVAISRDSL